MGALLFLAAACLAAPEPAPPPNILLLSVDTLRADRLGAYGSAAGLTPTLDALAAEAHVYTDAICEMPLTGPSMASMLTGRVPRSTGVTRNGLRLPETVPTVPALLQGAGYYTFCIQSNWTLKDHLCGLGRGFDHYDDDFETRRWGVFAAERYADAVTDRAIETFARRPHGQPWFAWLHYSDPHAPYRYHRAFNPTGTGLRALDEQGRVRLRYDTEVAWTDAHIARLLRAVPRANTVILFVADHGESLFEHGYLGHGRKVYQPGLHIPLLLHGPGITPGRVAEPVRGLDVGPTLLGLAGVPRPPGMEGHDLLHDALPADRVRVVETYGGAVPNLPGAKALMADAAPLAQAVLAGDWKLIRETEMPELYNLFTDPDELVNRAEDQPARARRLSDLSDAWTRTYGAREATAPAMDEEDREALRALGYVE